MANAHDGAVTIEDLLATIHNLQLVDRVVCVHASLRSFGHVIGGASTVVQALLDAGCTLLVPTFSYTFAIAPPPTLQVARNGWEYGHHYGPRAEKGKVYTTTTQEIDADMGAIPAAVLKFSDSVRGNHPLNSFSAVGPQAATLIAGQQPLDVYAPLRALVEAEGYVLLMGVTLESMTLLHHAEQVAGRVAFRRWAHDPQGQPQMVEAGSCSDGFEQLAPLLQPWPRALKVGQSQWQLFPAAPTLAAAAAAIRENPHITHCGRADCERCRDAMLGGPILNIST